jgi:AraC-like DNA-binding protein
VPSHPVLSPAQFRRLAAAYRAAHGFFLVAVDANGERLHGRISRTACPCGNRAAARRRQAAEQTLFWGEPVINLCCESGFAMWAVPLMHNQAIEGALLVQGVDLEAGGEALSQRVRAAASGLMETAIRENLTNAHAFVLARQRATWECDRFLALEMAKHADGADLRGVYLREEPGLLAAIREGRRSEARCILNRILVGIYGIGGERMDLLKSGILELVVMMSRAAVEAGADAPALLGANYQSLTSLAAIGDEEELAVWVRNMLETLIDAIRRSVPDPYAVMLARALAHMREHLGDNLRRDDVARLVGVSPNHFSRLMTERLGLPFSDQLTRLRIDRARHLLRHSERSITDIALACGFCDQSHFSKAFRRSAGLSPGQYRKSDGSV